MTPPFQRDEDRDLGFGSVVSGAQRRLLNRDGTFNTEREGLDWASSAPYHALLTMSWPRFLGLFTLTYFGLNALFALGYLQCGLGAIRGGTSGMSDGTFLEAFFFSIQTFATIGYGDIIPVGPAANALVTAESFVSILAIALSTGLIFARFSRPRAQIRFSRQAVIAPYGDMTAFEFRLVNERRSQMVEVTAKVVYTWVEQAPGGAVRRYRELALERTRVTFFPLTWTIVHPIDPSSPLRGLDAAALAASNAEFLVIVAGTDEALSQAVHARTSYQPDEIVWNARFTSVYRTPRKNGASRIDISKLHDLTSA